MEEMLKNLSTTNQRRDMTTRWKLWAQNRQLNARDVFPQCLDLPLPSGSHDQAEHGPALITSSQGNPVRSSLVITRLHKLACLVKKREEGKKAHLPRQLYVFQMVMTVNGKVSFTKLSSPSKNVSKPIILIIKMFYYLRPVRINTTYHYDDYERENAKCQILR